MTSGRDIIGSIDDAIAANLCACGCGQQIPARGPSPDFVDEKHQNAWRQKNTTPAWIAAARAQIAARDSEPDCDDSNCPCHRSSLLKHPCADPPPMKPSLLRRALNRIRRTK